MKRTIPASLILLSAVLSAHGALLPLDFRGLKPVKGAPAFTEVKYRIENGPAHEPPTELQNLTEAQLQQMVAFLVPDTKNPPPNLPPSLVFRMVDVLAKVDMHYKRPIPAAEWDSRLKEMRDEFVSANGKPGQAAMSAEQWEKAIDGMLTGFVKKLGDPHTMYMDRVQAKQFAESMTGTFVGVGAGVEKVADGVKLTTVYPGSPAEKAGLRVGDVVTAVDGKSVKGEELGDTVNRLRGPEGTKVKVTIQRLPQPVTVTRGAIQVPDLFGKMAAPGVGYVYFSQFGPGVDDRLFAKIDALRAQGASKLIIDLRGNPGGLLTMAESIASEFLQDADVITSTKRQGKLAEKALTDGPGRFRDMKLAIIVNGGSASASEILSAALQEHHKATIVGSRSYGKGSFQLPMQTEVPLVVPPGIVIGARPDGAIIKVTEGGWYTPTDRSIEGTHDPATGRNVPGSGGVVPDEPVTLSEEAEAKAMSGLMKQLFGLPSSEPDAALEKAIEVLNRP